MMKQKLIFKILFVFTIIVVFFIFNEIRAEIKVPELQVNIPGFEGFTKDEGKLKVCLECSDPAFSEENCPPEKCENWGYEVPWIGEYFVAFYKWSVGAIAVLAVIMIMIGGVQWMLAGSEAPKIGEAKKRITAAVAGLVLVLLIHQILFLVDSRLVVLKPITLGIIKKIEFKAEEPNPELATGLTETETLKFNPGIQDQVSDASAELIFFINCLAPKIKERTNGQKLVITSISDSAGIEQCTKNYKKPPCAHSQNSCHYGGKKCPGKSYALDLGVKSIEPKIIIAAIKECESGAFICYTPETPKCENHYSHLHLSIGRKHGCECN